MIEREGTASFQLRSSDLNRLFYINMHGSESLEKMDDYKRLHRMVFNEWGKRFCVVFLPVYRTGNRWCSIFQCESMKKK